MRFRPRTELRKYKTSYLNPPKIEFAMISITYPVICGDDGLLVFIKTWWTGRSAKSALKKWLSIRRDINPDDVQCATVTEFKPTSRFEPIGDRVEVDDPFLEAMA